MIQRVAVQITVSPFSGPVRRAFAALLLVVAACGDSTEADGERQAVVRDSAGVHIVHNLDPQWKAEARWTLDPLPVLKIGVEEDDPQRVFFRLTDARRLSDGRIVAANAGSGELRYFSADGAYLCSSGRQGAGPGEFDGLSWLQVVKGDTLIVHSNGGGGRLSVVGPDGVFARTIPIPRVPDVQFATPMAVLSNGGLLLRSERLYGVGVPSGVYYDSALLVIARDEDLVEAKLGPFPRNEHLVLASATSMSITSRTFGKHLVTAIWKGRIYVGTNERYEIAVFDTLGRLVRFIRLERAPELVSRNAIAHVESTRMTNSRNEAERALNKAFLEKMQYPAKMPYYGGMLADAIGNLWVSRYAYLSGPRTWDVFDADGLLLGAVQMPDRFSVRQITEGEIIGISRDESDVERVTILRLLKSGAVRISGAVPRRIDSQTRGIASYRRCG